MGIFGARPARIRPARGLSRSAEGHWQAAEDTASLVLETDPPAHRLSGRWVRLRTDLRTIGEAPLALTLAFEAEESVLRIRPNQTGTGSEDVLRLPRGLRRIRIEAAGPGAFQITTARVEPLVPPQVAYHLARRILLRLPPGERSPARLLRRAFGLIRTVPPRELLRRLARGAGPKQAAASYDAWIAAVEAPATPSPMAMEAAARAFRLKTHFSLIAWVEDGGAARTLAENLVAQGYGEWELLLCCPASAMPDLDVGDPRIKLRPRTLEPGRVAVLNGALAQASGAYTAFVEDGDRLPPQALFALARLIEADPEADLVYTDEDRMTAAGGRDAPFFKPDWSPETFEAVPYLGQLLLYRTALLREVGGYREGFEGALDYDLALRVTERTDRVRHLAQVLCHRAADAPSPTLVSDAARRALAERRARTGRLEAAPLVSIVIPSAGRDSLVRGASVNLLANCLASLRERSTYPHIEIVVVEHGALPAPARAAMKATQARSVPYPDPVFNFAAKMNRGAAAARGEVLVFLNDDIEVITPDWIEAMLSLLQIPEVGVVGAKLVYEGGALQHVGVVFGDGLPDHVRRGFPGSDPGYGFSNIANRNYLAVTGACMMVRRRDFEAVSGFDEGFPVNYNDVDLCLQIGARGQRTVFCAQAVLTHFESRNRVPTVDPREQARFRARWGTRLARDPYYPRWFGTRPPAFELDSERFRIPLPNE